MDENAYLVLIDRLLAHMIETDSLPKPRIQNDPEMGFAVDTVGDALLLLMMNARNHGFKSRSIELCEERGLLP